MLLRRVKGSLSPPHREYYHLLEMNLLGLCNVAKNLLSSQSHHMQDTYTGPVSVQSVHALRDNVRYFGKSNGALPPQMAATHGDAGG